MATVSGLASQMIRLSLILTENRFRLSGITL